MALKNRTARMLFFFVCNLLVIWRGTAAPYNQPWPFCTAAARTDTLEGQSEVLARIEVPATTLGCIIRLQASNETASGTRVQRLSSNASIAGVYDGSLGRPPAVLIQHVQASAAVLDHSPQAAAALLMPQDGTLQLQGLLLVNVTLADPLADASLALFPSGLSGLGLTAPGSLKLWDVQMTVSQQQLQQHVAYFLGMPSVVIHTNGQSYLYIHRFVNPVVNGSAVGAVVEAHTVTLLAPDEASVQGTPIRLLRSLGGSSSSRAGFTPAAVAAAQGDAAGVVNATDSYILAANNATLLPLLSWLIGSQETFQPLVVHLASNVSLAPGAWGSAWPAGGLNIIRQVLLVGSALRPTSVDFGMCVGQLLLSGRYANVTAFNVALENLAYGDEHSGQSAEGNSILMPSQLWAFQYRRLLARVVLHDCTLVLPDQRFIDRLVYWADAFNSDLDFWRVQTQYMRNALRYTAMRYVPADKAGEYVVTVMIKLDMQMFNTRLTTRPVAAPQLQLPFNSSIHQNIAAGSEDVAVGPVVTIEDLAVTMYNINKPQYGCSRRFILLPTPGPAGSIPYWGQAQLDYARVTGGIPLPAPQQPGAGPPVLASPDPSSPASLQAARAAWGSGLAPVWPPEGGQRVQCSVQFQGAAMVDVGFVRGMLVLPDSGEGSGQPDSRPDSSTNSAQAPAAAAGINGSGPRPLLLFVQMGLEGLPQGEEAAAATASRHSSSSSGGSGGGVNSDITSRQTWNAYAATAAMPTGGGSHAAAAAAGSAVGDQVGGSSWVSQLPAEAYTHLLWFVARNVAAGNDLVLLSNVTLSIPAPEAAQMAAAATAAIDSSGGNGNTAVLSMVYPTAAAGPLPVVYRDLHVFNTTAAAGKRVADSAAAAAQGRLLGNSTRKLRRQLMQHQQMGATGQQQQQQLTICVGSLHGLGIAGTNVCMVAADRAAPPPPDYHWVDQSSSSSSSRGSFPAWAIAVTVILSMLFVAVMAAAVFCIDRHRKRSYATDSKQQSSTAAAAASADSSEPDSTGSPRFRVDHSCSAAAAALPASSRAPARVTGVQQQQQQQQQQQVGSGVPLPTAVTAERDIIPCALPAQYEQQQQQQHHAASLTSSVRHTLYSLGEELPTIHATQQQLQLHEVIGTGSFGIVYKATWRGIPAAVKVLQLPHTVGGSLGGEGAAGSGSRREQMLVMEAALGTSINHPNIVQVYTYMLRPLTPRLSSVDELLAPAGPASSSQGRSSAAAVAASHGLSASPRKGSSSRSAARNMPGFELQLVMEYCPVGSLRAAIDSHLLQDPATGLPHYATALSLAVGVAQAVHHLHSQGVLHGDLKAGNVLLKYEVPPSQAAAGPPWEVAVQIGALVAKVADLGLACMLDEPDTHVSGMHRGTLSHMSPELLLHGRVSRASDVYAMGILLWELATGLRAFADCPKALLGAAVVRDRARPAWPDAAAAAAAAAQPTLMAGVAVSPCVRYCAAAVSAAAVHPPVEYRQLVEACWAHDPRDRPTFEAIVITLEQLIAQEQQSHAALAAAAQQPQQQQHAWDTTNMDVTDQPACGHGQAAPSTSIFYSVGEVVGSGQLPPSKAAQVEMQHAARHRHVRFVRDTPAAAAAAAAIRPGTLGQSVRGDRLDDAVARRREAAAAAVAALLGIPRGTAAAAAGTAQQADPAGDQQAAAAAAAAPASPFAMLRDASWGSLLRSVSK